MRENELFSTPRENIISGSQMIENAINRRQTQRQNMKALTEANKMAGEVEDFTAVAESSQQETEEKVKKESALENAFYRQGAKSLVKEQLAMRPKLIQEGTNQLWGTVIGEIIYESYWLDDAVKESAVDQITEVIEGIMDYVEENCKSSIVPVSKHNRMLKNIDNLIESTVKNVTDRIVQEAITANSAFSEFEMNPEEEKKFDNELVDLGKDEIIDLIKGKVAQVIQDERQRGKERSETFSEIDKTVKDNEEDVSDLEDGDVHTSDGEEVSGDNVDESYTLAEALSIDKTDNRYTTSERYISGVLENGAQFDAFSDPSWNEFKSAFSLLCKKAKNLLISPIDGNYRYASAVIDEICNMASTVSEDVPGDIKGFIMNMVSLVYVAVPPDEVIISRFGGSMGSPELQSNNPVVNYTTIGWTDLLVNIKTNMASIKNYCEEKSGGIGINKALLYDAGANNLGPTLESAIIQKKNQAMTRNIGNTLFEAMMIGNISAVDSVAMESAGNYDSDVVEDTALIESLLHYTVFETLDTIGLYKFRVDDIKNIKNHYIKSVSESKAPIFGERDSAVMSNGKDKKGKKKIRINTHKMKSKQQEEN